MSNGQKNERNNIWFPDIAPILYRGVGSLVQVQRLYLDEVMLEADKRPKLFGHVSHET